MANAAQAGDGKVHLSTRIDAGLKYRLGAFALVKGLRLNEALTVLLNQVLPPADKLPAREGRAVRLRESEATA